MRWKKLLTLCAASVSSVAFVAPIVDAAAATVTKVPLVLSPSAEVGIQSCVGETVTVTDGQFNVVYKPDTLFHRNIVDGLAVGDTTGSTYRLSGHIQAVDHLFGADGETYTFVVELNAFTAGGAGFSAKGLFHVTFTTTGDLVAYSSRFTITCR